MPGLTAKVFRTYNASITLDAIVSESKLTISQQVFILYYILLNC